MLNSRINKFIFKDGKVFMRLKTNAKNLKVVKMNSDYTMDFLDVSSGNKKVSIPVLWIEDFKSLSPEALGSKIIEGWGARYNSVSEDKTETSYYVHPENQKFGLKIGPIQKTLEGKALEVDWSNLQWGIS
jgi:hypothetical protein